MAEKRWRKKMLLAKLEATSGTAESPTPTRDAVQFIGQDVTWNPIAGEEVSREFVHHKFGASPTELVGEYVELGFRVELSAGGAAGTAPGWGPLMQACSWAETMMTTGSGQSAVRSVKYNPISESEKSITLVINIDGDQQLVAGAKGTVSLQTFQPNAIPYLQFSFIGLYGRLGKNPAGSPNFIKFKKPVIPSNASTPTFNFFGRSDLIMRSLTFDMDVQRERDEAVNKAPAIEVVDRSGTNGKVRFSMPPLAGADVVTQIKDRITTTMRLVHGVTAGSIIEIDAPKVEVKDISFSEVRGKWVGECTWVPLPGPSFDDDLVITVK